MAAPPTGHASDAPTPDAAIDADDTRTTRVPTAALVVLVATLVAALWYPLRELVPLTPDARLAGGVLAMVVPALLAAWLAMGVLRRSELDRRDRTGWVFIALAAASASAFALVTLLPTADSTSGLLPVVGAAAHLLILLTATVGVLHWVRRLSPSATLGTALDLACVAMLAYVVSWRTILSPALLESATSEGLVDRITLTATPALGTLLLVAVVCVLSQVGRDDLRGAELLATFGFGGVVASDLGMSLRGIEAGGLDDAWHQAILGTGSGGSFVALGWVLGIAAIGVGAAWRRATPQTGVHVPLIERSTTWELLVSLVPFALLGGVIASTAAGGSGGGFASRGMLAALGALLLARCTLVATTAIRSARDSDSDHLTGALSHRTFQERLPFLVEAAVAADRPISMLAIDIDEFGVLNDAHTHAEGDRYLREVAWAIRRVVGTGHLYRIGGDEFAVVLPDADAGEAERVAQRVAQAAAGVRGTSTVTPTLTLGVASLPEHAADAHELVQLANGTLYWGKLNGKDSVTCYDPEVVKVLSAEERLRLMEQNARLRAVLALARALDARDAYTARHSENVSRFAIAIAVELGWGPERLELLRVAGLLHDIGKIGVRDSTLRKRTGLTESERIEMEQHPVLGARMVAGVAPEEIVPWIVSHHERMDGLGYPEQLDGEAIPMGARILSVADTFDAMTSSRSYRPALHPLRAIEEIVSGAGEQFDPDVVRAFLAALRSGAIDVAHVAEAARHAAPQEGHATDMPATSDAVTLEDDPEFAIADGRRRRDERAERTERGHGDDGESLAA